MAAQIEFGNLPVEVGNKIIDAILRWEDGEGSPLDLAREVYHIVGKSASLTAAVQAFNYDPRVEDLEDAVERAVVAAFAPTPAPTPAPLPLSIPPFSPEDNGLPKHEIERLNDLIAKHGRIPDTDLVAGIVITGSSNSTGSV